MNCYTRMNYQDYIEIGSDKRIGKPIVKDTGIPAYDVLNWLSNGMAKHKIAPDFKELNEDMIKACIRNLSSQSGQGIGAKSLEI